MNKVNLEIESLLDAILNVPGDKIITLIAHDRSEPFSIDIGADGNIGYEDFHKSLFDAKLLTAFSCSGGVIIRQFLALKVERVMPNGKKMWIPRKNIYGVMIGNGGWKGLTENEVKNAHCTNAETGEPLTPEENVAFQKFPIK
jgi:hypothetical protein